MGAEQGPERRVARVARVQDPLFLLELAQLLEGGELAVMSADRASEPGRHAVIDERLRRQDGREAAVGLGALREVESQGAEAGTVAASVRTSAMSIVVPPRTAPRVRHSAAVVWEQHPERTRRRGLPGSG